MPILVLFDSGIIGWWPSLSKADFSITGLTDYLVADRPTPDGDGAKVVAT
jgi:hypothetical protein